ncbi:hypothetical protein ACHAO7_011144 [Fusarium culmorum]
MIDKIWKRFTSSRFEQALAVLPPCNEPLQSTSEHTNESFNAGYERAARECRQKVDWIIKECKTMNQKYRDPDWDLETDFEHRKGNCLNRLDWQKFDLNEEPKLGDELDAPKTVRRVSDIFEQPTFMEKADGGDVKQGCLDDCWVIAAFSALASIDGGLRRICVAYDMSIGVYGFVFHRDGEWIYCIIDDKLYLKCPEWHAPSVQRDLLEQVDRENGEYLYRKTYQTGSKALFFAQCRDSNETWAPLLEKAYAKAHGDYTSLAGGWIGECLEDLCGGVTTEILSSDILDVDRFWDEELSTVNQKFLFGASTGLPRSGRGNRNGISEGHAYVVLDARMLKSGQRLVKLRNPWGAVGKTKGNGVWEGPWCDGSKEWTRDAQQELGHEFGNDAIFWMPYEDLIGKFSHLNRTRLFLDPSWYCCQRWVSVAVPWLAVWRKQFSVKLASESPLVLVLAQLDRRYFYGLHGQYSFKLHFRLHAGEGSTDDHYMVRSHGNYLMDRSVSVELDAVSPGSYTIYVKITAERDLSEDPVEEVVRQECFDRVDNEKLAQVGQAYNLAHSKVRDYMDRVSDHRRRMAEGPGPRPCLEHYSCTPSEKASRWLDAKNVNSSANADRNVVGKVTANVENAAAKIAETASHHRNLSCDIDVSRIRHMLLERVRVVQEETEAPTATRVESGFMAKPRPTVRSETILPSRFSTPTTSPININSPTAADAPLAQEYARDSEALESAATTVDTTDLSTTPRAHGIISAPTMPHIADLLNVAHTPAPTAIGRADIDMSFKGQQDQRRRSSPTLPATAPDLVKTELPRTPEPVIHTALHLRGISSQKSEWQPEGSDGSSRDRLSYLSRPPSDSDTEGSSGSKKPKPWNAVCITNLRVYSTDEKLTVRTFAETGDLL